jgi:RNA recognition motif-containing protein
MTKHVYVGNLSSETTEATLRAAFGKDGRTVTKVAILKSPRSGRPRGFGFVEMENEEQAAEAIHALQGFELDGKAIKVSEGKPRPEIQLRSSPDSTGRSGRGGGGRRGRR